MYQVTCKTNDSVKIFPSYCEAGIYRSVKILFKSKIIINISVAVYIFQGTEGI